MGGQKFLVGFTFLIVPLILLFVFTYLPFFKMFEFSFYKMKYLGSRTFIGLENYLDVFQRDDIFGSLKLSFYYMGGALLQMALALFFATILSFKIRGGNFFKGAIFFPFLVNGIALGFIFKFFYTRGFVLDTLLGSIGIDTNSLPYWLKDTSINNFSLVVDARPRYKKHPCPSCCAVAQHRMDRGACVYCRLLSVLLMQIIKFGGKLVVNPRCSSIEHHNFKRNKAIFLRFTAQSASSWGTAARHGSTRCRSAA